MSMHEQDAIPVHVMNPQDFVVVTEEHEPEHFSFSTVTLIPGQASQELLGLDPLRKDAAILPIDAAIVLCDSVAQSMSPANQVASIPAPDGAYVPMGTSVALTGTAAVWGACQVATRVSVIINRRKI